MTKAEKKRSNGLLLLCVLIIALWVLVLALDAEQAKTVLAVIGAVCAAGALMWVITWIDKR